MNTPFRGHVLLVGEGDFSFSIALVRYIPEEYKKCLVTTSLETEETILKHRTAMINIKVLKEQGVTVFLETDATQIHISPLWKDIKFDRIIFNFPHSGGKSNHKKNRKLLSDFFCSSVQCLKDDGQILMTLCKGQGGTPADRPMRAWHDSWQVVSMAANAGLMLKEVWPFVASDFPEYSCTGFRSQDKGFNTEGAITHVFQKGEIITIPEVQNIYFECMNNRISRKLFQEENHPMEKICSILEEKFSKCFSVHKHQSLSPVLENRIIDEMIEEFKLDKKSFNHEKKYDGCNYFPNFGTKYYSLTCETNCLGTKNVNISSFRDYLMYTYKSGNTENAGQTNERCSAGETNQNSLKGEIIHTTSNNHLRFSMLEHVKYILDDINCRCETEFNGELHEESGTKMDKAFLHLMKGQVCRPCHIAPQICPVKSEMLGVIRLGENVVNSNIVSDICKTIYICLKEAFQDLNLLLDMKEDHCTSDDFLKEIGTVALNSNGAQSFEDVNNIVAHIWIHNRQLTENRITHSLIVTFDLSLLTYLICKLSQMELLFSDIKLAGHCFKSGSHSFDIQPISLYPVKFEHDMSFWENERNEFDEFLFFDVIRGVAGDSVVSVKLIDSYICDISGRKSRCYRLHFQSHDKVLSYDTSWKLQSLIRLEVAKRLEITLR